MNSSTPASVELPFFFFNDTATTEIYTLSLHDALPIFGRLAVERPAPRLDPAGELADVLGRRYPQPEPLTLLAVPPLGEIVLAQHDVAGAGLHFHVAQAAVRFPALPRGAPVPVVVPGVA